MYSRHRFLSGAFAFVLVFVLWSSFVSAFFKVPCAQPVVISRLDPIVQPGQQSGHVHTVMGSSGFSMSSTYDTLFDGGCTTCGVSVDKSAYWVPSLYYRSQDGKNFTSVAQNGGSLMYYLFRRDNENIPLVAFPEGFKMVTGSPYYRSDQGTLESQALSWACIDYSIAGTPQTGYIPDRNCPDNLRMQLVFPSCWDGVNLDSSDHKSHVAYPSLVDNGVCPSTHPVRLVTLFYEVEWRIQDFANMWYNSTHPFVMSTGDPTGYGLHGDFQNGWDVNILQEALNSCNASSGSASDCPVFSNYLNNDGGSCSISNPFPEPILGTLDQLPGCNPIQFGPDLANSKPSCSKTVASSLTTSTSSTETSISTSAAATTTNLSKFTHIFTGLDRAVSGSGYMTYTLIISYSASLCADRCVNDPSGACIFFNIYTENRPTGQDVMCTLWNVVKSASDATNFPDSATLNFTLSDGYLLSSKMTTSSTSKSTTSSSSSTVKAFGLVAPTHHAVLGAPMERPAPTTSSGVKAVVLLAVQRTATASGNATVSNSNVVPTGNSSMTSSGFRTVEGNSTMQTSYISSVNSFLSIVNSATTTPSRFAVVDAVQRNASVSTSRSNIGANSSQSIIAATTSSSASTSTSSSITADPLTSQTSSSASSSGTSTSSLAVDSLTASSISTSSSSSSTVSTSTSSPLTTLSTASDSTSSNSDWTSSTDSTSSISSTTFSSTTTTTSSSFISSSTPTSTSTFTSTSISSSITSSTSLSTTSSTSTDSTISSTSTSSSSSSSCSSYSSSSCSFSSSSTSTDSGNGPLGRQRVRTRVSWN